MELRLQKQLGALETMLRKTRSLRRLTRCWLAAAALGLLLILIRMLTGWNPPLLWLLPFIAGTLAAVMVGKRTKRLGDSFKLLIATLEREHPELRHLLSTAVEQKPDAETGQRS